MTRRGFPLSVVLPFAVVGVTGTYAAIFWTIWATSFAYDRGWSAKPAAYNDPLGPRARSSQPRMKGSQAVAAADATAIRAVRPSG